MKQSPSFCRLPFDVTILLFMKWRIESAHEKIMKSKKPTMETSTFVE